MAEDINLKDRVVEESKRGTDESRVPGEVAQPSPGLAESAPMGPESETASQAEGSPEPTVLLNKVMQGITTSLHDLKAVVKEAHGQPEHTTSHGASSPDMQGQYYQDLFDWAPDAFLVTDTQLIIKEVNQAAATLLNTDWDSLRGKHLANFIAEEDRAAFQATMIQLREGGEKQNWELRAKPSDGQPFPVFIDVRAQQDRHDELIRMLWLWRDARGRKAEEETLRSILRQMKSSFYGIVLAFSQAVEMKDPLVAGHQKRVAQLVVAIGRQMAFSLRRLEGLKVMGLLHDVGKIIIPTEILSKPGVITNLECEMIKTHCQAGYELLKDIEFPWPVAQAVQQHHERLDGSGYPAGLTDADILLEARILAVADVVEAMVCPRPYGPAQGIDRALQEIHQQSGILYDAEIANICLKLFVEKGFKFNH
jgi:PAS domain S-box-containing protein